MRRIEAKSVAKSAVAVQGEPNFYVDLPTADCIDNPNGAFKNVALFHTRRDAIKFAQEHFGADDQGRVSLVTG